MIDLPALALTGFDFLFVIAFTFGLLSLNLLVALREEGEVPRAIALGEMMSHADPAIRAVSSVPGLGALSAFSFGYLKRVPGADVALGVTAYQLAASTQAAVASARRGRTLAREVARSVSGVLEQVIDEMEDIAGNSLEVARHATRGAMHAGGDLTDQIGRVSRGAVLGTLRAMPVRQDSALEALHGAGYGVVQGAVEAGIDPTEVAADAVEAARQVGPEMGVASDQAAAALAKGAMEATAASCEQALAAVQEATQAESS